MKSKSKSTTRIIVTMPIPLKGKIAEIAASNNRSISNMVVTIIQTYLNSVESKEPQGENQNIL